MENNLSLLFEISSVATPADLTIIKESYDKATKISKVIFKTKLQTAEEVNANRRYYSRETCANIVEGLSAQAKARSLFQEIDHPMAVGSETDQKRRALTVQLSNCGSLLRDIWVDGNNIIGEVETLSGFKGPDLRNIIMEDKANIGFSVRMFGKLKAHPSIQEVVEVVTPLKPITYDVVTNPSHKTAHIINFIPESISELDSGDTLVTESGNQILTLENAHIPISSRDILNEYLMMVLQESFNNVKTLHFKF